MIKDYFRLFTGKLLFFWMIICLISLLTAGNRTVFAATPKVSGGYYHTIALDADGTVWTWGYNKSGQLGDGTTSEKSIPVKVNGLTNIIDVSGGAFHSLALDADGKVWAWGENNDSQLGDGTTTDRKTPVAVNGLSNIIAVSAGMYHSIALKSDGTVWAWGENRSGQLGNNSSTDSKTPVQVESLEGVIAIASGNNYNLSLKSDGTVWSWGENYYGQLGDGTTKDRSTIVKVSELTDIVSITAGTGRNDYIDNYREKYYEHSLAVKSDGTAWAWGNNEYGQFGNGETDTYATTPVQMSNMNNASAVAAGYCYSIVLTSEGIVWACGRNYNGYLGDGTNTNSAVLVQVLDISEVTSVGSGNFHTIAIKTDGTLWSWGHNLYGQLGDGTFVDRHRPVQVENLNVNISAITGAVIDVETGIGIEGSTIQTNTGGYSATTDASGVFELEVEDGIYTVTATAEGYETASKTVEVNENTPMVHVRFELEKITSDTGDLSGSITDADTGLGIGGVTVSDSTGNYAGTTDTNGFYQITEIPAGSYIFNASATGYKQESVSGVKIVAGEAIVLDFILETAITNERGSISGRVTNAATGLGIKGATVQTGSGGYTATTGANGRYLLSDVEVGTYALTASAEGYESATENGVVVTENATTTVNFTLTEIVSTGHIIGVVTDADTGVGIEGAKVKVKNVVTGETWTEYANADGYFEIKDIETGTYKIKIKKKKYKAYKETVELEEEEEYDMGDIELRKSTRSRRGNLGVPRKRISSYQCPACVRHAQPGSLVWTKVSHQSCTESHAR